MTDQQNLGPNMTDLLAAVGEVLLSWGHLETAMRERIAAIQRGRSSTLPKTSILIQWRNAENSLAVDRGAEWTQLNADIDNSAAIRNCLAHGLSSASANPWDSREPQVECRLADGTSRTLMLSELKVAERDLHKLRMRVQTLARA